MMKQQLNTFVNGETIENASFEDANDIVKLTSSQLFQQHQLQNANQL